MKPVLSRSSLIGFGAMIVVTLVIVALVAFYAQVEPGQESLLGLVYMAWLLISMLSPVALPVLVLIVALITWQLTRNLSTAADVKESKKRLMVSVWVSTGLATVPCLLLTLVLLVGSLTTIREGGADASGLGMAMFFSMMCLFWNVFLVLLIGFLARLLIREKTIEQAIPTL